MRVGYQLDRHMHFFVVDDAETGLSAPVCPPC